MRSFQKDQTTSSSETVVECTDKPNPKAVWQKHGYDESKCGWARQSYPVGGKLVTSYTMALSHTQIHIQFQTQSLHERLQDWPLSFALLRSVAPDKASVP